MCPFLDKPPAGNSKPLSKVSRGLAAEMDANVNDLI